MRVTIKLKLALTFTAIILLASVVAWLGINSLGSLNGTMEQMVRGPVQRVLLAGELRSQLLRAVQAEKLMLLAETPDEISHFGEEASKERANFAAGLERLRGIASVHGREILAGINSHLP